MSLFQIQINSIEWILFLVFLAGLCMPLGGLLARAKLFSSKWLELEFRHFVIALGGGILLGAVALVLVPEGMAAFNGSSYSILLFITGGLLFFGLEKYLGLKRREQPQLTGMVLDYLPEALALGGLAITRPDLAPFVALLIGLQNLPEGFNAFHELENINHRAGKTLAIMFALSLTGPLATYIGYLYLANNHYLLGSVLLISAGGILYLIFQDIAPQSKLQKHWAPSLGAVLGFATALIAQSLL